MHAFLCAVDDNSLSACIALFICCLVALHRNAVIRKVLTFLDIPSRIMYDQKLITVDKNNYPPALLEKRVNCSFLLAENAYVLARTYRTYVG